MQPEVLRDEGRGVGTKRHRVALVGSRDFGQEHDRKGAQRPRVHYEPETHAAAAAVTRLIARWVMGKTGGKHGDWSTKEKGVAPGPGLHVVSGGAPGADTLCENIVLMMADGLRRRTPEEYEVGAVDVTTFGQVGKEKILAAGLTIQIIYADWDGLGKAAGPFRNQQMVDTGLDEVLAFYSTGLLCDPEAYGGTNDMVRRSLRAGARVHVYEAFRHAWRTL